MKKFNSPLGIYKILPKTNCRQCDLPTCMAFCAAVFKAQKKLADCPALDKATTEQFEEDSIAQSSMELRWMDSLKDLKEKIAKMNFLARTEIIGAESNGEKITVKCLGKKFEIDAEANLTSECHKHAWFAIPLLSYLLFSTGKEPAGEWVPFRELKSGATWNPLFSPGSPS